MAVLQRKSEMNVFVFNIQLLVGKYQNKETEIYN